MDLDKLKTLIDAMAASDLAEMTFSEDGWTLRLVRGVASRGDAAPALPPAEPPRATPVAPQAKPAAAPDAAIRAPMSGIVHLQPAPNQPAFVSVGSRIAPGAVICLVEAMKTFIEVRADRDGSVDAILVASGDEIELGQPLMRVG